MNEMANFNQTNPITFEISQKFDKNCEQTQPWKTSRETVLLSYLVWDRGRKSLIFSSSWDKNLLRRVTPLSGSELTMSTLYSCCKIRRVEVTTFKALLGYNMEQCRGRGGSIHFFTTFVFFGLWRSKKCSKKGALFLHFFYTFFTLLTIHF